MEEAEIRYRNISRAWWDEKTVKQHKISVVLLLVHCTAVNKSIKLQNTFVMVRNKKNNLQVVW